MLEAKLRDVKVKGRTIRNEGYATGTLKRKDGNVIFISILGYKLETYLQRNNNKRTVDISFDNEVINTKIDRLEKDVVVHNVINIDLIEI